MSVDAARLMRCTLRLEIAVWIACGLLLAGGGLWGYYRYLQPPPLEVVYYRVKPVVAAPGEMVKIVSGGIKSYSCPVKADWFLLDSTGRLYLFESPAGFNNPTGYIRHWVRALRLPSDIAPGPAYQWEVVSYDCPIRDYIIFTPRAAIVIVVDGGPTAPRPPD